ncbi:MAG TPA: L,D-transpeptidase [Polyangiaceae bacterium]|nr:L,D-transpeptidase [Polyangiaceae bacterium]
MPRPVSLPRAAVCLALLALGCRGGKTTGAAAASASAARAAAAAAASVDHGELDTKAPDDAPKLAATVIAATVYKLPDTGSRRLGYVRLGNVVKRDRDPVPGRGCKGDFFHVYPTGYVCTDEATTNLELPLVRAANRRPDLGKPMPYKYAFVRANAPQYLRVPTRAEQEKSEFKLDEHLTWFAEHHAEVQTVILGANDLPLDARGIAVPGMKPPPGFRQSTALSENELLGGAGANDPIPFWLKDGRQIPNISGYDVPASSVFADRVRRKTGLSLVGAFDTENDGMKRRFAVTVDLRLIPATKLKPDTGSPFHGIELSDKLPMPFAWVVPSDAKSYELVKGTEETRPVADLPRRVIVPLTGKARIEAGERYYQTSKDQTIWLKARDLDIVVPPPEWPDIATRGGKWIDISITQQTLVLYQGKKPYYATLVSTGRDKLGDPKETLSTPRGSFKLTSKHVAAAMDSEENSSVSGGQRAAPRVHTESAKATVERLKKARESGEDLDEDDKRRLLNIDKGRDPEYGITVRRGAAGFELRDVPWIQYFASGYALHGAYWHDVFGIPRSHGCVNLSPIDARVVFRWTDPPVPDGWHGINIGTEMGEGTAVIIRE